MIIRRLSNLLPLDLESEPDVVQFHRLKVVVYIAFLFLAVGLLYPVLKVVGIFYCEDNVMSNTGCVQMSDDLNTTSTSLHSSSLDTSSSSSLTGSNSPTEA